MSARAAASTCSRVCLGDCHCEPARIPSIWGLCCVRRGLRASSCGLRGVFVCVAAAVKLYTSTRARDRRPTYICEGGHKRKICNTCGKQVQAKNVARE